MKSFAALLGVLLLAAPALLLLAAAASSTIRFDDTAAHAGLNFIANNSATPQKHQIETMLAGVAVLDYDGDGRVDVYFVNGAAIPSLRKESEKYYNRLFHNNGDGTFTDVTARAGVAGAGYSMGVAVGDYDNDGEPDIFLANVGSNQLLHNNGDGNPDAESLKTAQQLMDGGRWAEAIPVLKELAGKHPEAPALTYGLGRCYFEVEDYNAAVTSLREAAQRIPGSAEVRFFLGSALGLGGNFGEAIRELRAAMDLDPEFEPAYRAFGMFRVERAQYLLDALAALETAVRLDPQDARALYWLGEFHRGLGELTKARPYFDRAYRLDPESPLAQLGVGQMSLNDGDVDQALVHFDAVLKQAPGLAAALLGRARALYYKGQFEQALAPAKAAWEDSHEFEERRAAGWILVRIYRALGRDADPFGHWHDNVAPEDLVVRELLVDYWPVLLLNSIAVGS